ncbi:unnamed protein product [Rotaria sordida]|uniref:Uncharacterized protein n=3 Tax=Rotaria sordida TaxID=392033 RepID=A0A813U3F8_9BILA|nr:unnamed protein product [Rotaria sordida]CAF0817924.1 unnamed protein product [Rotaria sordida]CAF3587271.1 unnamed protein product [Rotaria sordida]CAF3657060.1 unnamed protein product [Rotaria sordida]
MSSSTTSRYRESTDTSTPTKIYDKINSSFTEEYALDDIAKEAELRLQHEREQNREARQIRHKELEKNAQDDDDEDLLTIPLTPSTSIGSNKSGMMNMNGTLETNTNSLLLQKFLNGDIDLRSLEQRDLRRLLSELELKYKSLMIINSSMYNEKQALHYQVDTYKDILDEHYETFNQIKRQLKEKCKDFDLQKQTLIDLQENNNQLKEILINCEKLIQESDMKIYTDEEQKYLSILPIDFKCRETFLLSNSLLNKSINENLKRILNEKYEQFEQIIKLKLELDEAKNRLKILKESIPNSIDLHHQNINNVCDCDQQKQLIRQITDLNNRLQQLAADNGSLQQENIRYEAQLTRYKQQLDDAERVEDELKQERRQLQRELRIISDKLENECTRIDVLQRENERLRVLRKKDLLNNSDDKLGISKSHSPLLPTNSNDIQSNSPIEDSF